MSDYGIRVAKDGYDALTDEDYHMAFTSKLYSDKVLLQAQALVTISGTSATATLNHNLGYVPQFWAFDFRDGEVPIPSFIGNYNGSGANVTVDAQADVNSIYFNWQAVGGTSFSTAMDLRVIVFIFERSM